MFFFKINAYPMSRLATLYRTNADGYTSQWRVWAGEKNGHAYIATEFGRVGGALRISSKEITTLGRHDSELAHAKHQAKKKWQDKQSKEGYVISQSHADAALHAHPSQGEEEKEVKVNIRKNVKKEEEEEDVPVLPMLANTAVLLRDKDAIKGMKWPVAVQPKIDGFRCIARVTGHARLTSRKNIPYKGFQSIRDAIDMLRLPKKGFGSGRFYLDGEFFVDTDGDFGKLSSAVKKGQTREDYDLPELQYIVYDCFDLDFMEVPYLERANMISTLLKGTRLVALGYDLAHSLEDVDYRMMEYLENGDEGLMVRALDSPYVLRKRSKYLLKHKEFQDSEFKIIGHAEGEGQDAGTVIWQCETTDGLHQFMVRPMGTRKHRSQLLKHAKDYYGRMLTVKYFGLDPRTNIPRFPVGKAVREDFDYAPT